MVSTIECTCPYCLPLGLFNFITCDNFVKKLPFYFFVTSERVILEFSRVRLIESEKCKTDVFPCVKISSWIGCSVVSFNNVFLVFRNWFSNFFILLIVSCLHVSRRRGFHMSYKSLPLFITCEIVIYEGEVWGMATFLNETSNSETFIIEK